MLDTYSGATRVHFIAGDPIAQVKAPSGVTRLMRARGADAVVVPAHVTPADFADFVAMAGRLRNVDGLIVTVPHKFAALEACATVTPRARSIGAVNVMRRDAQGRWFGDMCDGEGHVTGLRRAGCDPRGRRALLVGAGGAGSAIAHALVDAGVAELALHDADTARRDALLAKLRAYGSVPVRAGSDDPAGFGLVTNATPAGMREGDALPVRVDGFASDAFVSEVVTVPAVTPMLAAARARGLGTMTGVGMFEAVAECLVDFLLAPT